VVLESEGALGGVLVMWDKRVYQFGWAFSGVYRPNVDADRHLLWEELAGMRIWWAIPWCISDDLNVVRFHSEKLGEGRHITAMLNFSDFILELGLINLPLQEGQFTRPTIKILLQSLALIDSYCPPNGKCIFRVFL
jgi:hypothetical protein